MNEPAVKRGAGRPTKSPAGKRITLHINLSPPALEALRALCVHPVQAFAHSAMIEHLILEASRKAARRAGPPQGEPESTSRTPAPEG